MITRLAFVAALLAVLIAPTAAQGAAAPFPKYRYKVSAMSVDTKSTWEYTTSDIPSHTWGTERTTATAKRVGQVNAWNWNVPMKGSLVGSYGFTATDTTEACATTTGIATLGATASANIVPLPRGRVLVAMGIDIGQSGPAYSALRETLRQQCVGAGSIYESKAVGAGLGSSMAPGIVGGSCDGYVLPCVIVPRSRFLQPRVLLTLTAPTTRTHVDATTSIPYIYTQTWRLDLRRATACGRNC